MSTLNTGTTDTDQSALRTFARGGLISLAGSIAQAATGFLLTIVVARLLGAAAAGVFFIVVAIFSIASEITELGADEGIVRSHARLLELGRADQIRRVTYGALTPVTIASVIVAVALFVLAPSIAAVFADPGQVDLAVTFLRIATPFLAVSAPRAVVLGGVRGLNSLTGYILTNTAMPASRPLLAVLVVALGFGPAAVMLSWSVPIAVTGAAGVALLWVLLRRAERGEIPSGEGEDAEPESGRSPVREFWSFSTGRGFAATVEIGLTWLDVLLVGAMVSNAQAGIYASASRFITSGQLVLAAARIAVAPQIASLFARRDYRTAEQLFNTATGWVVAGSWPIYLALATFGPVILTPFGDEFVQGATALAILAVGQLCLMAAGNVQTILLMGGKSSWTLGNKIVALVVNVGLNLLLVPSFGIIGAAVAWASSTLADTILASVQVRRSLGLRLHARSLLFPGLWALFWFCGAGVAIRVLLGTTPATFTLYAAVACAGYGAVLWRGRARLQLDLLFDAIRRR